MTDAAFAPAEARFRSLLGPAAACALDEQGRVLLSLAADEPFPAASVIKIALVMALHADAAEGRVSLEERVPVGERAPGSGVLGTLRDVDTFSLRDLAMLTVSVSDNTATNRLIDRIGIDRVNERLDEWGCPVTRLRRRMFDLVAKAAGVDNVASAAESCALLLRLLRGECVDRATSDAVLALLRLCQHETFMPRYLPPGTQIAHKSGWVEGVCNDAGIVWAIRPVIVAGFTREQRAPDEAAAALGLLGWCALRAAGGEVPPLPFEARPPA